MYHLVEDKVFIKKMKNVCSGIINELVQLINNEGLLEVEAHLVGSGASNLITQNGKGPVDLDYNLCILDYFEFDIDDCEEIKEYIRKSFNKILKRKGWGDCRDSKSALTTKQKIIDDTNKTKCSIDLCIVTVDCDGWYRLIHKKTGYTQRDEWIWNPGKNSKKLIDKVRWLKENDCWEEVRETYVDKKNMYLKRQDYNHSSFNCYIEAVNEVYNKY